MAECRVIIHLTSRTTKCSKMLQIFRSTSRCSRANSPLNGECIIIYMIGSVGVTSCTLFLLVLQLVQADLVHSRVFCQETPGLLRRCLLFVLPAHIESHFALSIYSRVSYRMLAATKELHLLPQLFARCQRQFRLSTRTMVRRVSWLQWGKSSKYVYLQA